MEEIRWPEKGLAENFQEHDFGVVMDGVEAVNLKLDSLIPVGHVGGLV